MNDNTEDLIKQLRLNAAAGQAELEQVQLDINMRLPSDYVDFLRRSNGAEGPIGASYLVLWTAQELESLNEMYAVSEFAPGLLLFGSDGGGTAFAFDTRTPNMAIVEVPFVGMSLDSIRTCSESFSGFLECVSTK